MFDFHEEGKRPDVDQPAEMPVEAVYPTEEPGIFRVYFRGFGARYFNVLHLEAVDPRLARAVPMLLLDERAARALQIRNGHLAVAGRYLFHAEDVFNVSASTPQRKGIGLNRAIRDFLGKRPRQLRA